MSNDYIDPNQMSPEEQQALMGSGQKRIPVTSDELATHSYNEERVNNIISQISPENQLYDISMRLKGFIKINGEWTNNKKSKPLIPEEKVDEFINYISTIVNQNTALSNFSEQEVNRIMNLLINWVVDELDVNAEDYGVEDDYTKRDQIGNMFLMPVFTVLKRAVKGSEASRMWKSLSLAESNTLNPPQNKLSSLAEAMKFWK